MFKPLTVIAAVLAATAISPAAVAAATEARVVDCASGSCLRVTGRRDHPASVVQINDHPVAVEGSRKWRATLPVETVRQWSAPYARAIRVSVLSANGEAPVLTKAALPIGLLGHKEDLAMLVVRMK